MLGVNEWMCASMCARMDVAGSSDPACGAIVDKQKEDNLHWAGEPRRGQCILLFGSIH